MSAINCSACAEIIGTGVTDITETELNHIRCGEGLTGKEGSEQSQIQDVVDCFIGKLGGKVDQFNECDWKEFQKLLLNNLTNTLEVVSAGTVGAWTQIYNIYTQIGALSGENKGVHIPISMDATNGIIRKKSGATRNPILVGVNGLFSSNKSCDKTTETKADKAMIRLYIDAFDLYYPSGELVGTSIGTISKDVLKERGLNDEQIARIDANGFQQSVGAININAYSGALINIALGKHSTNSKVFNVYIHSITGSIPTSSTIRTSGSTIQTPFVFV